MDGISLKISGNLLKPLETLETELPRAEKRALYRSAYFLRDKIRQSLSNRVPKASVQNPKYNDTLLDAVQFTKVDGASLNVNAMGNRNSKSGTYRTRFFENDTRDRYQKTRNGIRLKKKKFLGHITGTHFFNDAVTANQGQVLNIMRDVISEYVQETYDRTL